MRFQSVSEQAGAKKSNPHSPHCTTTELQDGIPAESTFTHRRGKDHRSVRQRRADEEDHCAAIKTVSLIKKTFMTGINLT